MDSAKINDWMQIFGTFAVVASLIFIGLQMKQTQSIAMANQYQDRTVLNADWRMATLQSETALASSGESFKLQVLNSQHSEALKSLVEDMSPEVAGYRYTLAMFTFLINDNNHFQYQSGFLTTVTWNAYREELKEYLRLEPMRFVWEITKHQYRPDFRDVVEQLVAEIEN